jgi:hypothetical protein
MAAFLSISSGVTPTPSIDFSYTSRITSSVAMAGFSLIIEPPVAGNFNYNGCFQDLVDGATRVLPYNILVDPTMTLEMCAANCNAFDFFGTEFGDEVRFIHVLAWYELC